MNAASVLGIIWLIFWVYWFVAAFSSKRNASFDSRGAGVRILFFFLVVFVLRLATKNLTSPVPVSNPILLSVGFVLVAIGLGLCIWARLSIGRNWGMPMTQKIDTNIVTSGPYQFIRHPIYTGIMVALLGTCFVIGFYWLIIFVVVGSYFVYSAIVEERNLTIKTPLAYMAYKRRTKMFIPYVI